MSMKTKVTLLIGVVIVSIFVEPALDQAQQPTKSLG